MSIYPAGQCTDWCATDAPWCNEFGNLGNAKDWAANWRSHGGHVDALPRVGDIACFQPGIDGADFPYGHVAVVVSVGGNTFTVSEMNGPAGPGHVDQRVCALVAGVEFLAPPGSTPPAPAPAPPATGTIWVNFAGTVDVDKANVRGGPGFFEILRSVPRGTVLEFDGYAYGPAVLDAVTGGLDHRWFHIARVSGYGWIASALVNGNPPNSHP